MMTNIQEACWPAPEVSCSSSMSCEESTVNAPGAEVVLRTVVVLRGPVVPCGAEVVLCDAKVVELGAVPVVACAAAAGCCVGAMIDGEPVVAFGARVAGAGVAGVVGAGVAGAAVNTGACVAGA